VGVGLERVVRAQQRGCAIGGSEVYTRILDDVAADVARGGPCRAVLAPYGEEPLAAAVALRLLAAVHELVLSDRAPALARHYPSVGGTPGPDLGADFLATVAEHRELVTLRTAEPIQTNEVGRSASLLGGFLAVARSGLPLRVLEVGSSAGLNLRFDHYRYEGAGGAFGPEGSPVRFVEPWEGREPGLGVSVEVAERRGCDVRPLDPADPADRLRLRACLWPDQPERRARLDAALGVAEAVPVPVDRADAASWVAEQLAVRRPGQATVVVHSIVAQYLDPSTRRDVERDITAAGERATPDAPVAWLRMEPASSEEADVRLTCWPSSGPTRERILARSAFHGPPVRWAAPAAGPRGGPGPVG
jgi:hypothetical protein